MTENYFNETFKVDDFIEKFGNMAPEDIYDKIDQYFKIEREVFAEVANPVTRPNGIIELIRKREEEATNQSPFPPNRAIFLQGIYAHFLQKWLEHYKINENIFVVDNSELAEQPFNAMKNLESFLELSDFYQELGSTDFKLESLTSQVNGPKGHPRFQLAIKS